jgi:hypothetical protein
MISPRIDLSPIGNKRLLLDVPARAVSELLMMSRVETMRLIDA